MGQAFGLYHDTRFQWQHYHYPAARPFLTRYPTFTIYIVSVLEGTLVEGWPKRANFCVGLAVPVGSAQAAQHPKSLDLASVCF